MFKEGLNILRSEGVLKFVKRLVAFLYGHYVSRIPLFPAARYNGVQIKKSYLPWHNLNRPTYESGLIQAIEKQVQTGDTVTIVGGGYGITAVKAAEKVGKGGNVIVFEGSKEQVEKIRQITDFNSVSNLIEIHHNVVGIAIEVYGDKNETLNQIDPIQLPNCDVLQLDCEGAEIDILHDLEQRPRVILVETHGMYDAPSDQVRELLVQMSYDIISEDVADESKREFCIENDIKVLTAVRS